MPNHWDSHTHSSGQLYSICSSEETLLNYLRSLQKWLLRSGWNWEVQQIKEIPEISKYLLLWSVMTAHSLSSNHAFYCKAHIRCADNMMKSIWSHVPRASLSIRLSPANYSSFSLLLMQMLPPHQPFHSGKTDCKCSSYKYLRWKNRQYKWLDIFEKDDVM